MRSAPPQPARKADHLKLVSDGPAATRSPASDHTVVVWRRSQDVACVTLFAGDRVKETQCFADLEFALQTAYDVAGCWRCPLETTFSVHGCPGWDPADEVPF